MSKLVVAVTQRSMIDDQFFEDRDSLDQRLISWLLMAECIPVAVSNSLGDYLLAWLNTIKPGAILLSGGGDIGQIPQRDQTEFFLLSYAKNAGIPVLGICRGMQMLAKNSGGSLVRVNQHVSTRHKLYGSLVDEGKLPQEVNSFHNWSLNSCPQDYQVLAVSKDQNIEAIRHSIFPWEGWMWHPERESNFNSVDLMRVKQLFLGMKNK